MVLCMRFLDGVYPELREGLGMTGCHEYRERMEAPERWNDDFWDNPKPNTFRYKYILNSRLKCFKNI
jgi:hypothetical protein